MRLIDADALIVALKRKAPISDAMRVMWAECLEEVRHTPTIEPERKGKWIPCHPSELPKDMILWVTFHDEYGCSYVETVFWDMTDWNMDVSNAVAYIPYEEPEPYKADGKRR